MGDARQVGNSSALNVELLAILFCLKMAWRLKLRKVILESDFLEAINLVKGLKGNRDGDQRIIDCCRELLSGPWDVDMRHVFREAKSVTDWLAKMAIQQCVDVVELELP